MPVLATPRFKRLVRTGRSTAGSVLRKRLSSVVEPLDERRVRFTISTAAVDREGDVIDQEGWDLAAYMTNPVVLWSHQSENPPIGRCPAIGLVDGALRAVVEYVPADMPVVGELAEMCLRMNRTGFLSAVSVGFRPLEYDIATSRDDGESWFPPMNFLRQELMEFSLCSIPCNPEALIDPAEVAEDATLLDLARAGERAVAASSAADPVAAAADRRKALRAAFG